MSEESEEICEPCVLNVGAAVMINLCENIECLKEVIDCKVLTNDFKEDKITAKEIIEKVKAKAHETKDVGTIETIDRFYNKIYEQLKKDNDQQKAIESPKKP